MTNCIRSRIPAHRLILACIGLACLSLNGCAMRSNADTGPQPINRFDEVASNRTVTLEVYAGKNLNPDNNGQPLSLLVKFYVLRDLNTFEQTDFNTFLDNDATRQALGNDLIEQRETTLVPTQKYTTHVPMVPQGGYLGVVALFRNPAENRWREAFQLTPGKSQPITIGMNACAMSVTRGAAVMHANASLNRLTNVFCPGQEIDQPTTP